MKKISHYFRKFISMILKIITAFMLGLASSMGKSQAEIEKQNNKKIEGNK